MSLHLHGPGSGEEQHSRVRKAPCAEPRAPRHPTPQSQLASPSWTQPLLLRAQHSRAAPSSQHLGSLYTVLLAPHPPAFPQMSRGAYRLMGFCRDDLHCIRIPYNQIAVRAHCYSPFPWVQVEDFCSVSARHSHKLVFIHLSCGLLRHKEN